MNRIVLLGATGSIGENTLRVVAAHPGKLRLAAVAARTNWQRLAEIARLFQVPQVGIYDEAAYRAARASGAFPPGTRLVGGLAGLIELAQLPEADTVLVSVVGTIGLEPALAALRAGKALALASKEILLLAGKFVMAEAKARKARLLPVDSEHSAIAQCIQGHPAAGLNAANEVAVDAFLEGRLPFLAISRVVEQTLAETRNFEPADLPSVMAADAEARRLAAEKAATLGS